MFKITQLTDKMSTINLSLTTKIKNCEISENLKLNICWLWT